jgi:hypothetical protein
MAIDGQTKNEQVQNMTKPLTDTFPFFAGVPFENSRLNNSGLGGEP